MLRHGTLKKYFVQNDPDLPTLFFTLFLHFLATYKMTLFKAVYTSGKKKTGALCLGRL